MGADNQQERLDAQWITGFVDGEGCFHVALNKQPKMTVGYQVLPEFRIVQHQRDEKLLHQIRNYFGFGKVTTNHDDRKEFRVRGMINLKKIVSFFEQHPLRTSKQKNFAIFVEILNLMNNKEHLNRKGLENIAQLVSTMNTKIQIRLESSETVCQTSSDEDTVRTQQRCCETDRNGLSVFCKENSNNS